VADRVHAAMEHEEDPAADAPLDLRGRDAGAEQLTAADHPVLSPGELDDDRVR
jgi:hypothetical protein